jgi:hypothetical protein
MKKISTLVVVAVLSLLSLCCFAPSASAEEVKIVGTVQKIEMAADNKSATVILKDSKTGEDVTILVNDELTLDKFMDKRIVEGAEIRCKFEKVDGKNTSKMFKKTAGC